MCIGKILLEYVWIDSIGNTRSKIKIINWKTEKITLEDLPEWNFDGSSTGQAEGKDSDVLVRPCAIYSNPFVNYIQGYLVLCDCLNKDGSVHPTNNRVRLANTYSKCIGDEPLVGIEQEYVIFEREYRNNTGTKNITDKNGIESGYVVPTPYKWIRHDEPGSGPQGPYYCSVGGGVCLGRKISDEHLEMCLKAGLAICGTNAEVMASQWEYQIGPINPLDVSDQLWISRYILNKVSEKYDCIISLKPKPYSGDWNGSGAHTNFSTKSMRESGGINEIISACEKLSLTHQAHMEVYGIDNHERMSGIHETSSMNEFSWGISNRGKSVRIPLNVAKDKCGYFEDRRPGANMDPYLVCEAICTSVCVCVI